VFCPDDSVVAPDDTPGECEDHTHVSTDASVDFFDNTTRGIAANAALSEQELSEFVRTPKNKKSVRVNQASMRASGSSARSHVTSIKSVNS
jgi:hypothetical protein